MDEPLSAELKLPEDSNLQQGNLKDDSLSEIVGTSDEQPSTEPISEGLEDVGIDSLDDAGKGSSFEVRLQKESHDPLPPKESSFQVTLEPKPTDAPPLLLLDTKSGDMEDDSVFTSDLSTMPDQLLAEPPKRDELDERTEHEIASNIEEQLREFDGSEDDISLDKNICVAPSMESTDLTRPEDIFGEDTSVSGAGSEPACKSDTPAPLEEPTETSMSIEQVETSLELVEDPQSLEPVEDPETLEPVEDSETLEAVEDIAALEPVEDPETLEAVGDKGTLEPVEDTEGVEPVQDPEALKAVVDPGDLEPIEDPEDLEAIEDPGDLETVEDPEALKSLTEVLETKEEESIINHEKSQEAKIDSEDTPLEEKEVNVTAPQIESDLPDDLMEKSDDSTVEQTEELPSKETPSEKVSTEDILTEGIPAERIPVEKTPTEELHAKKIPTKEIPTEETPSEENPVDEIQSTPLPSEEQEFQLPAESSMEVDEEEGVNPPEEQKVEETAGKSSDDVIEIEDVEMSTVEDSKDKIDDLMLDSTDPLAKSGKTEDLENQFDNIETDAEKSVEEPMDEDVCIVEPLSSTTIEEDSARVIEMKKTKKVEEAKEIEEAQNEDKVVEAQEAEKETNKDKNESSSTADVEIIEINESDESKETTNNDAGEDATEKESDDVQIVEIANISVEEVINSAREEIASTSAEEVSKQQRDLEPSKEESSTAQQDEDTSNEDVCLLPDSQKELTGAEKEQAILARENAEKEAEKEKKAKEKEKQSDTRQSTPTEETTNEEDQVNEESETPPDNLLDLAELEIKELNDEVKDDKCYKCRKAKPCKYKFLRNGEIKYLCDIKCVNSFRLTSKETYNLTAKKVIITSIIGVVQNCVRCRARKHCGFRFKDSDQGVYIYLCQPSCLNLYIGKNVEKYLVRRKKYIVEDLGQEIVAEKCIHCGEKKMCKYFFKQDYEYLHICDENCFNLLSKEEPERFRLKQRRSARGRDSGAPSPLVSSTSTTTSTTTAAAQWEPDLKIVARTEAEAEAAKLDREVSFTRRCRHCSSTVEPNDQLLHWEMMDFCNEVCLANYQNEVGAFCYLCKTNVPMSSLGKYCVRFGFDVRQFCTTNCLERHKKGLKVCSFCQKDISYSKVGFLAPVGTRGVFKDFCSQSCMSRYDEMCNSNKKALVSECAVCNHQKLVRVEVLVDGREHQFCSNPCFSAFKFVNNIHLDQCGMCSKYFERKSSEAFTIYQEKDPTVFCSKICLNIYISLNRKIVPCQWCKVKKYDFDMIQKQQASQVLMMICSVNCLNQQKVAQLSVGARVCDNCHKEVTPQYHLTMSDGTVRNFCNYNCVLVFRGQFGRSVTWTIDSTESTAGAKDVNHKKTPFPTGQPKRARGKASASAAAAAAASVPTPVSAPVAIEEPKEAVSIIPVISNVESLAQVQAPTTSTAPVPAAPAVLPSSSTEPVTVVKKRGRPRSHVSVAMVPPEQTPQQSPAQVQRQSQTKPETSEDDQPLVRLRSLRSGGGQNIQTQESPKNQHNVSITAKALTSNSHTQTKPVQKKSIGISAVLEKVPEEPKKPEMVEKSTMTTPEKPAVQEKEKPKQVTITDKTSSSSSVPAEVKTQVVVVPQQLPTVANKQTMCKPAAATKGTSCRPHPSSVQCQTDDEMGRKILVPIPVPIYVPQPMYMYSAPFPVPVPIPLPIPVPIFIPTTRNSAEGIMKEIKKIQDKMPTDPFEAELLMMAEMVAGDKKKNESDSDSEPDAIKYEEEYHPPAEPSEPSNSFGEDVLQMALKMATECDEPAVDLESAMTTNTITPPATVQHMSQEPEESTDMSHQMIVIDGQRYSLQVIRGRKRPASPVSVSPVAPAPRNNRVPVTPPKRQRREIQVIGQSDHVAKEPVEKPDANLCLKYTFGVNAWKQWVMTKNADLEKSSIKRKPFKSELLQLTADELNYSLCLFVKEVRKPNGSEYAPDTIYYLVLGIQQYLYENGRIDNIFTDPYYERFTDCLDEVAKKFSVLYNDSQYIVTRVEEEHLWECKQLGAHSPHVLLSTLMFFNTKHFNLTTVEEHMQLSFSHIMKHWKRSPPGTKSPGSRNVLLRFYPPQSGLEANPKKKKVYEQQENEDNPLRCPVKLYEFYLSKCPESVKTRNDVFYLQPERSCVPDSPVWYSTQPLSREALSKMLHRVKMVKEINIALLTS